MRGKELTPVLVARPVEWAVVCQAETASGPCYGSVRVVPGPSTSRWYEGDFGGRGRMKIGQCDRCGRTYRVRKG
jgi:hypothetical protein